MLLMGKPVDGVEMLPHGFCYIAVNNWHTATSVTCLSSNSKKPSAVEKFRKLSPSCSDFGLTPELRKFRVV